MMGSRQRQWKNGETFDNHIRQLGVRRCMTPDVTEGAGKLCSTDDQV